MIFIAAIFLGWKKLTFIQQQGCIKLIKRDSNVYKLKKDLNFKCCSFKCSIHQRILKKSTVSTKTCSSTTVFNIDNNQTCFLSSKSSH